MLYFFFRDDFFPKYHFGSLPFNIGITRGHCFINIGIAQRNVSRKYSGRKKNPISGKLNVPAN